MGLEDKARQEVDQMLHQCGWVVQRYCDFDPSAGLGIALREVPLKSGRCVYLLFVERKPVGVIEGKKAGVTLSTVSEQSAHYGENLPDFFQLSGPLPFYYESIGVETYFRNERDPESRSRRVFAFHRPQTLAAWLRKEKTLCARLAKMPATHPLMIRAVSGGLEMRSLPGGGHSPKYLHRKSDQCSAIHNCKSQRITPWNSYRFPLPTTGASLRPTVFQSGSPPC